MTDPVSRLRRFLRELKRRNVYQVAATYAVIGFVLIQVADLTFVRLGLPAWTVTLVIVLVAMGFPLAIVLAWAFERTPDGVRRTWEDEPTQEDPAEGGIQTGYKVLLSLGLLAAALVGGWYLTGGGVGGETTPRLGDRSIAVLPFEALGQQEPGTFTEGMHDALLARLSNVSGLKVISRTAVDPYRHTEKTTGEVARELGVRWVLEGAVQEMGDGIQVNVQLIDPMTETHAWADTYRRDLTAEDLFDLQSGITRRIARSLEAKLTSSEAERIERRPTEDLDAYQLYVQGKRLLGERTGESIREAMKYFRSAIRQDSTYALAWAGLAEAQVTYPDYGPDSLDQSEEAMREGIAKAQASAHRALNLEADLAEAHAALGVTYLSEHFADPRAQKGPAGLLELRRAVRLKPSYGQAHSWLGTLYLLLGRPERGLEHLELAVQISPARWSVRRSYVRALLANRRYEEAVTQSRMLDEQSRPEPSWKYISLLHLKGWEAVRKGSLLSKWDSPAASLFRIVADGKAGDTASARQRLEKLRRHPGRSELLMAIETGMLEAALGNKDTALAAFRRTIPEWTAGVPGNLTLRYLYPDVLDSLRDDPRFRELIGRINEQYGLNLDGSLPDSVDVSFGSQSDE